MERAEPYLGRFLSRFLMAVAPGIAASALAAIVLYALHLSQTPEPAERLVNTEIAAGSTTTGNSTPADDNMTAEQRRELTRQMLKARRENPEIPVAVTPTARPAPAPATPAGTADATPLPEPKARPERTATAPLPRLARPASAVATPAAQASTGAITPPPAAAAGAPLAVVPAAAANPAVKLPPVNVATAPPPPPETTQRGFAGNVFSSLSTFAGTAANATGNTVNWVITLPGRAISAGGKLLTGESAPASAPQADPTQPKQNLL